MAKYRLFTAVLVLSLLIGSITGAVAGFATATYFSQRSVQTAPAAAVSLTSSKAVPTQPQTTVQAQGSQSDTVAAAQKLGPAVVTIVNTTSATRNQSSGTAIGSGIIFDKSGYIMTNAHVVDGEQKLEVIFASGGKSVTAKLIGADPRMDVAVIKIEGAVPAVAILGDSTKLQPGQPVIAIGSALGNYRNTVTAGVISALNRKVDGSDSIAQFIQTDTAINHGNSGGPLANLNGEVVGINTAVVRSDGTMGSDVAEGLGFSIPINAAKQIADKLIKSGSVIYPYLGVQFVPFSSQTAAYYQIDTTAQNGALVRSVATGGPADKAGLQADDVITNLDGKEINETSTLSDMLIKYNPNDTVELKVVRGTETLTIKVKLAQYPSSQPTR